MRTPEPPDRGEREGSPPRLSRPKRTTRPPKIYAREQEIDNERRTTRPSQKKTIEPEAQPDVATSDDSAIESDDLDGPRDCQTQERKKLDYETSYTRKNYTRLKQSLVLPSPRSEMSYRT
ncbi:hypothetical protein DTO013E5_10102 [Penicillium roqueforti]|nr:hypothetical protein DTO012A1_10150 [Penicillium roqueforti]KAI2735368.1 hypothetical protein DTO013F2_10145 [Penicillium roqueforti]KAI2766140.1 hypothetical protein DTO012A8_8645 [Penicillium roqueforti]KAI3196296.1 hypothetical protein DTO013E5_10102 [Penicillium roqueforti]